MTRGEEIWLKQQLGYLKGKVEAYEALLYSSRILKDRRLLILMRLGENMNNLTRNGVAKDLSKSPYIFTEFVNGERLDLYFSSKLHLNRFTELRQSNYNMIYNYIYKRFKYKVDCRLLADCNLYQKIENRGFYIRLNKEVYLCPNNIILNGESKRKKSYAEWCETLMINSED